MELDLTTFILQILNFLVLLWLLHRFVYGPLRAAIAKRQAATLAAEEAYQAKLKALQQDRAELQAQRANIAAEKQKAEAALAEEIARERASRLAALEKELSASRERGLTKLEAQLAERETSANQTLNKQVDTILRAHLARLASPAFEAILLERFIEDLAQLDAADRATLDNIHWSDPIEISTAFPITEFQQSNLLSALSGLLGKSVQARWKQQEKLIAGIRVGLDGKEIEFSLNHSLSELPVLITEMQANNTHIKADA